MHCERSYHSQEMLFLEIISKSAKMPKYGDENSGEKLFLKIPSSLSVAFFFPAAFSSFFSFVIKEKVL